MYTIDASIWVNAFDQREPGHATSRQLLDLLAHRTIPVVVPSLVLAEVAGAISRTRKNPSQAQVFAEGLGNLPHVTMLPLDAATAQRALEFAAQYGLRGADAVYAAVADLTNCTLITLDNEQLTRLAGVVGVCTPATAVSTLTSPPAAGT